MDVETIVSTRQDREICKTIITPGDYTIVPYEDSRCKITVSDVKCTNDDGPCTIEPESVIFGPDFDGTVIIGDTDFFLDKDVELILQQMCCGETCTANMMYKDKNGKLVKDITCQIHLSEVTEEQLISDWSWNRLYESALHHKDKGVSLVRAGRIADAFRRFSKGLKMIVAIEPFDEKDIEEDQVKELIDVKVKLYNNLAHCQLQFEEFEAAKELCVKALDHDPQNLKSRYRRCVANTGLKLYEDAWADIQYVLSVNPDDRDAQARAEHLNPIINGIKADYNRMVRRMFNL
ncbi:FK506-binding protein-like [Colias croceus]|uniref:FK506-binding protein-like n=1 Tax=Colias crocea TaxID=72248 RepID=UPI001E27D087|nr:FK506-binding protein-like [Colias croceus]